MLLEVKRSADMTFHRVSANTSDVTFKSSFKSPHYTIYCVFLSFQIYSPEVYNINYYECTHEMNDEEKKHVEDREESLFPLIDEHIKIIMPKLTLPDGKMIEILHSSLVPTDVFNHGFTTRYGGVSTYNTLSSLNLMYSDKRRDPDINVQENRRRLALTARFNPEKFRVAKCVHGADVWVIGDPQPDSYDALVTDNRQFTLAAPGADCPVVLFCDPVKKVNIPRHLLKPLSIHQPWEGFTCNLLLTLFKRYTRKEMKRILINYKV